MIWEPSPANPITDGHALFEPGDRTEDSKIAKSGNDYYMVVANGKYMAVMDIYLLTSPALTGPWKKVQAEPAIARGAFYEFDFRYLRVCGITLHEGTWYLYYAGQNIFRKYAIGVATTSAKDFPFGWKKSKKNPVFKNDSNDWESLGILTLSMHPIGAADKEWYGHYTARGSDKKYHLGICYGANPYGPFTRDAKNPVLGPEGKWDSGGPARADIIKVDGKIHGAYESRGGFETPFYVGEYQGDSLDGPFANDPNNPTLNDAQYANPCLWHENGTTYMIAGRKMKEDKTEWWRYVDLFTLKK